METKQFKLTLKKRKLIHLLLLIAGAPVAIFLGFILALAFGDIESPLHTIGYMIVIFGAYAAFVTLKLFTKDEILTKKITNEVVTTTTVVNGVETVTTTYIERKEKY